MPDLTDKTVQELVDLGKLTGDSKTAATTPGAVPYAVIPANSKIESLEKFVYNEHAKTPERIKEDVTVLDPESFVEYYQLFSDENSRVFAYEPEISVLGVLDYHGAKEGTPRWGDHKVTLSLRESEEWSIWNKGNNVKVAQMEFAEFLEQNATDITAPTPAAILEVAHDLEATTEVQFGSASRTQDGQVKFKYSEEIKATVGGGQVAVPDRFTLSIPVFVGGSRVNMDALLRFRVNGGKLQLWYTLMRPAQVKRTAFLLARNAIADALKIQLINGALENE